MEKYTQVRVKKTLVCIECDKETILCDECGESFYEGDDIVCWNEEHRHESCFEKNYGDPQEDI